MARPNLRSLAAEQAHAEYAPQIRGVRRETRNQVRSIRSSVPAQEASLQLSAQQLRHAGLSGKDLAIALSELAHRTADVGASGALQTQQVQQDAHGQVVDLLQSEGQAQNAALAGLQHEAATHQQDVQDEFNAEKRGLQMDILKEEALKKLGLGSYANSGMTPTQQRASKEEHHTAAHYAKEYVQAAKGGLTDEKTGKQILPAGPHNWDDTQWGLFIDKIASKGVDVTAAERAVQAVRDHFQPGTGTPQTPVQALAAAAGSALGQAPAQIPAAIAQFGADLLHRR